MDSITFSQRSSLASGDCNSPTQLREEQQQTETSQLSATQKCSAPACLSHSSTSATRTASVSPFPHPSASNTSTNLILPKHLTGLFVRPASYYLGAAMTAYHTPEGLPYVVPAINTDFYSSVGGAALNLTWPNSLLASYYGASCSFYGGLNPGFHPSPYTPSELEDVSGENGDSSTWGTEVYHESHSEADEDDGYFDGATLQGSPLGNHGYPTYIGYTFPTAHSLGPAPMTRLAPYQPFQHVQLPTFPYAEPDELRKYCDLHGLAKHLPPNRLNNALYGKCVDIIEDETEKILLHKVHKKMLVLFIGRERVSYFLKTVSEHDKSLQVLRMPLGSVNHVGLKVLIAWMIRACKRDTMHSIEQIRVPKNTFAAISLARTLATFGCYQDRDRVDHFLNAHHFRRPFYFDQVKEIWNLLPRDSKYTFRMIKQLSESLEAHERGLGISQPDKEAILEFIEHHPELKERIIDQARNEMWIYSREQPAMVVSKDTNDTKIPEWNQYQQREKTPRVVTIVMNKA